MDALILTIQYETPPSAEELGDLFAALGRDYRGLSGGRTLVLTSVEQGSVIATLTDAALAALPYLKDAVAVFGGIKAIADLAKSLKYLLGKGEKPADQKLFRPGRKKAGIASAETLLKIAIKSKAKVSLRHRTDNGETLEFEITPSEALNIRSDAENVHSEAADAHPAARAKSTRPEIVAAQIEDVKASLDRVFQAGDGGLTDTELDQIADIIVSTLEMSGFGSVVHQMISDLQARGFQRFASALQERLQRGQRGIEAPVTT